MRLCRLCVMRQRKDSKLEVVQDLMVSAYTDVMMHLAFVKPDAIPVPVLVLQPRGKGAEQGFHIIDSPSIVAEFFLSSVEPPASAQRK